LDLFMGTEKKHVCPWWLCFTFDNPLRKWLHDPVKIVSPYVRPGDHAADIGAGMGYFSIPLAKLVGPTGRVTALDIQPQMLAVLKRRAQRMGVADRITTRLAVPDTLGEPDQADFVLAFWMVHEVPDQQGFLSEIIRLLRPGGRFLLVEPKMHVSGESFLATLKRAEALGFALMERPPIRLSRSVLLGLNGGGR
jgi:ubiquinone/menaquinone biosynthesis C-methylase UbiE